MRGSVPSRGFTLVEFLLALLVGAVAMLGVWVAYNDRLETIKAQKTAVAVKTLIADANHVYANSQTFTSQRNGAGAVATFADVAAAVPTLPEGLVVVSSGSGSSYSNYWGGTFGMTVENSDGPSGTNRDMLVFTLDSLPSTACLTLLTNMGLNVYDMRINGTLVGLTPAATAAAQNRNQIRFDQAVPLCFSTGNRVVLRTLKEYSYALMRYHPFLPTMNAEESARVLPQYNRIETAMARREAAQLALP